MAKKKNDDEKKTSIKIGDISDIKGQVTIAGGDVDIRQTTTGLSAADLKQLIEEINGSIDAQKELSAIDKGDLKIEVKEILSAVTKAVEKNKKVDEGFLSRRFRNIARMAPDILDVVVGTLANPLAGLGIAAKKIAEKAKEEAGQA